MKEITIPEISENVEKGTVISVLVSEGDSVNEDDPVLEIETDKAAVEVPSPFSGTISEILVSENDEVKVGQTVMKIEPGDSGSDEDAEQEQDKPGKERGDSESAEQSEDAAEQKEAGGRDKGKDSSDDIVPVPASPSTRRLVREIGVNIREVKGSGPGGRISKEDVKEHAKSRLEGKGGAAGGSAVSKLPEMPDFSRWGETEEVELSKVRAIIAENTEASWRSIPHVTQFDKADISGLESFRRQFGKIAEKRGAKLTVTSIIVKITALALRRFPRFNATYDAGNKKLILKKYVNLGVAVDTDRGLLVPVIQDADKKSILDLAGELGDLAERTRNKKINPDELEGGNFIISNLGGIGGTNFTPVIFPHQIGILAVDRAEIQPVYENGEFLPKTILPLGLSYDHRVIDGADGARFLRWIAQALQEPLYLHLEGENNE